MKSISEICIFKVANSNDTNVSTWPIGHCIDIGEDCPKVFCLFVRVDANRPDMTPAVYRERKYVHGKQLVSCRDGQLSLPNCSWASLS